MMRPSQTIVIEEPMSINQPIDHLKDYRFRKALRPFSLFIALAGTFIIWARSYQHADFSIVLASFVVVGATLAQASVNLINDWSDRSQFAMESSQYQTIRRNFLWAVGGFSAAGLLGFLITLERGWQILLLALIGLAACLAYTFEPFHLKRRGLGLLTVFVVMGPIMMLGSGFAMTGVWELAVLFDAVLFAPLISLVLLANELRDYRRDIQAGDKTLSVRIGFPAAKALFLTLIVLTVTGYTLAIYMAFIPLHWLFLIPLVLSARLLQQARNLEPGDLKYLPPETGRLVFATGLAHTLALSQFASFASTL